MPILQINLTEIHRQAADSLIVQNAHKVNHGNIHLEFGKDFKFIHAPEPIHAREKIVEIITTKFSDQINPRFDIQVLASHYRGDCGIDKLNSELQSVLNFQPREQGYKYENTFFSPNDRVMHIKNNYDLEIMNGEIGFVYHYDQEKKKLIVMYEKREVEYELSDLSELRLAYACTIHKSQGCEFPVVIIALAKDTPYPLRARNLLYTAITRAKRLCIIVGDGFVMNQMIKNDQVAKRNTRLCDRIKE